MARAKEAKEAGDVHGQQMAQLEVQQLMRKHNVNPISNLVFPVAQAAVFMTMFFALRGLSGSGIESLHTEGFGWVQDLAAADPYYILPVASTALTLLSLEVRSRVPLFRYTIIQSLMPQDPTRSSASTPTPKSRRP
jgi:YidC/Oxa1 family membrane protein insertase